MIITYVPSLFKKIIVSIEWNVINHRQITTIMSISTTDNIKQKINIKLVKYYPPKPLKPEPTKRVILTTEYVYSSSCIKICQWEYVLKKWQTGEMQLSTRITTTGIRKACHFTIVHKQHTRYFTGSGGSGYGGV